MKKIDIDRICEVAADYNWKEHGKLILSCTLGAVWGSVFWVTLRWGQAELDSNLQPFGCQTATIEKSPFSNYDPCTTRASDCQFWLGPHPNLVLNQIWLCLFCSATFILTVTSEPIVSMLMVCQLTTILFHSLIYTFFLWQGSGSAYECHQITLTLANCSSKYLETRVPNYQLPVIEWHFVNNNFIQM